MGPKNRSPADISISASVLFFIFSKIQILQQLSIFRNCLLGFRWFSAHENINIPYKNENQLLFSRFGISRVIVFCVTAFLYLEVIMIENIHGLSFLTK